MWDYLFSGCYKDDKGQLKHIEPNRRREGDRFAIALSKDTGKAWFNNQIVEMEEKCFLWSKLKYHGLNGDAIVRGTYHYVPVSFLKKVFSVKTVETAADGLWAEMVLEDDTVIQIARGVKACVVNNCVEAMDCETVERDGMLCISQITMWCCRPIWRG